MGDFIKAYPGKHKTVVYEDIDGPKMIKRDGSRAWRNKNPGNIQKSDFAKNNGGIGDDGHFAIFPDYKTGRKALEKLLVSKNYHDLDVESVMNRYAPPHENNTEDYIKFIEKEAKVKRNTKMHELSEKEIKIFADAVERHEGTIKGETIPVPRMKPIFDATGRFIRD